MTVPDVWSDDAALIVLGCSLLVAGFAVLNAIAYEWNRRAILRELGCDLGARDFAKPEMRRFLADIQNEQDQLQPWPRDRFRLIRGGRK